MSSDSSSNPSPPPPDSSSSSSSPPPPDDSQSPPPPPTKSSPPPPTASSPPPPAKNSPPPPSSAAQPPPPPPPPPPPQSSSPPPPSKNKSSPPPPDQNNSPPSSDANRSPLVPSSRSGNNNGRSPSPPQLAGKHDNSSNQTAIIAGVAAGAGLLLIVLVSFIVCFCRKKKQKKPNPDLQYYSDNNSGNLNNQFNPPSSEYLVKIPPTAPGSAGMSSEFGWTPAPPPRPPNYNSSEMSSAGFSGPYGGASATPPAAATLGFNQSSFTYEDLAAATGGFAQANLLGQGGFGYVHKGVLPSGKEVAVKSLKTNSGQGEREFHAEVDIISRVHHRHLVSLVGYCTTGAQRLLVYEYVDNGTLEYHLHGDGRPTMDWPTRHQIALGSAKGFAYLHEDCHPRIIHRDIKAANILIDSNFEAKVADFGLAKLSNDNYTHVSTRIMGTFGYLAPEYASSGKLTEKSDVYSFGIMLLELITGRRPVNITSDDDGLVDWARPILSSFQEGGSYEELVDPRLGDNYDKNEMLHMVSCAGACIRHSARGRPKMSQIVRALEGDVSLDDLNGGSKASSQMSSNYGSDYDLRRYAKGGLSSQEYSSSDEHTVDFQSRR